MVMGPLGAWLIKKIDEALDERIPTGFEMLINNFSAGILAVILVMLGQCDGRARRGAGQHGLRRRRQLPGPGAVCCPFADIIIEPAKVLFLNNAINHGVLTPLGVAQVRETGKAIHFMLETNPGPGLGLLLAYCSLPASAR